jgi:hypothetical protein
MLQPPVYPFHNSKFQNQIMPLIFSHVPMHPLDSLSTTYQYIIEATIQAIVQKNGYVKPDQQVRLPVIFQDVLEQNVEM